MIGLETHVELGTASKMFCGCSTAFGAEPNTQVCPVCLGLPGSLPVANAAAIEYTIRIGLALNCSIAPWCRFARKNYFYPDMPKNFQISQYDEPLCIDGYLDVEVDGETYRVGIERVHLEEDTGKTLHVGGATGRIHGADYSLVDYNRAGIPLVEIVTKPVAGTGALAPEVARAYVTELRDMLRTLGVSDVRMEQGSLRCDVNISLTPTGSSRVGHPHRDQERQLAASVERAVRSEIERQAGVLDAGGRIKQETRHFHEDTGTDPAGRSKEEAEDYRYFPEPDLVPVAPDAEWVEEMRAGAARAAGRPPGPAAAPSWGLSRRGAAGAGQRRRGRRWSPTTVAAGAAGRRGPQLVAGLPRPAGQRAARSSRPALAITPGAGGRGDRAGRRRARCPTRSARQVVDARAGPARATPTRWSPSRGLAVVVGHQRADRRRRRRDRGQPRRGRQGPRRQAAGASGRWSAR